MECRLGVAGRPACDVTGVDRARRLPDLGGLAQQRWLPARTDAARALGRRPQRILPVHGRPQAQRPGCPRSGRPHARGCGPWPKRPSRAWWPTSWAPPLPTGTRGAGWATGAGDPARHGLHPVGGGPAQATAAVVFDRIDDGAAVAARSHLIARCLARRTGAGSGPGVGQGTCVQVASQGQGHVVHGPRLAVDRQAMRRGPLQAHGRKSGALGQVVLPGRPEVGINGFIGRRPARCRGDADR